MTNIFCYDQQFTKRDTFVLIVLPGSQSFVPFEEEGNSPFLEWQTAFRTWQACSLSGGRCCRCCFFFSVDIGLDTLSLSLSLSLSPSFELAVCVCVCVSD